MNLTLIAAAVSAALAGSAGFGLAWTLRTHTIDTMILDAKDERISQQRAARATIERTTSAVIAAQNDAQRRAADLRRAADGAAGERERLRESVATAVRAHSGALDACNANAAAVGGLLDACGAALADVARDADGWQSAAQTLEAAWPK